MVAKLKSKIKARKRKNAMMRMLDNATSPGVREDILMAAQQKKYL